MAAKQLDEEAIFKVACRITSSEARADYLEQVCGDDQALFSRVATLLQVYADEPSFLEAPASGAAATIDALPLAARPGCVIGPYKLREQLAEGGMGVVFVAEQTEPVRRKVALKIIKPGMATKDAVTRFEAERQALAMMDHPNIARVFDAGETDAGHPFFVMELVLGIPITEFCDHQKLTTRERLQLLLNVCRAVQHAHQRGIIHRDIKPSNVLVSEIDDAAVAKVIDFGVAKAVSHKLTDHTVYTQVSQMIGTPLYMSPEQAAMGVVDVDIRSDVYSLGVLLYELLTDRTPFDRDLLKQVGFDEIRRVIREDDPSPPSELVSTLQGQVLSTVADRRRSDPRKLLHTLHGELDWITLKALEKDRNRRYESVSGLAEDIERYLDGRAVQACPPSTSYRLRKFSHRYRAAISAAVLLTFFLLTGTVTTTWQMVRAINAETEAEAQAAIAKQQAAQATKQSELARSEAERADSESRIAKAINTFVTEDLLTQANPTESEAPDPDVRLRDVVDRAAAKVHERFKDDPLVEAAIHFTLGETYQSLGLHSLGLKHAENSLSLRQAELGESHFETLGSLNSVASALAYLGRLTDAEKTGREALDRSQQALGDEHETTLEAKNNLAVYKGLLGRVAESERLWSEVLEVRQRIKGDDLETLIVKSNLAAAFEDQGAHAMAEKLRREVLGERQRIHGDEHLHTAEAKRDLATFFAKRGRYAEAEAMHREALDVTRRLQGREHPGTLRCLEQLAVCFYRQRRFAEAEKLLREGWEISQRVLGAEHFQTVNTMHTLALTLGSLHQYDEAISLARKAHGFHRRFYGEDHHQTRLTLRNLSDILSSASRRLATGADVSQRDPQRAVDLARERVDLQPDAWRAWSDLAVALYSVGQWQQSVDAFDKAYSLDENADLRRYVMFLAMDYWQLGQHDVARDRYAAGAAWIAVRREDDPDQQRFRAEAEKLLGLTEQDRSELIARYYTETKSDAPRFLTDRGKWHQLHGNHELALADLRHAVEQDPTNNAAWNAWNRAALAYYRTRNWEGAEVDARLAIQLAADDPKLLFHITPLFLLAGRYDEYRQLCVQLLDAEEGRAEGQRSGVTVVRMWGLDPTAVAHADRVLPLAEQAASARERDIECYGLGRAYYRAGDYERAVEWLDKAWEKKGPQTKPLIALDLAVAHHLWGHSEEARRWFEMAIAFLNDSDHPPAGGHARVQIEVLRHEAERLINLNSDGKQVRRDFQEAT